VISVLAFFPDQSMQHEKCISQFAVFAPGMSSHKFNLHISVVCQPVFHLWKNCTCNWQNNLAHRKRQVQVFQFSAEFIPALGQLALTSLILIEKFCRLSVAN